MLHEARLHLLALCIHRSNDQQRVALVGLLRGLLAARFDRDVAKRKADITEIEHELATLTQQVNHALNNRHQWINQRLAEMTDEEQGGTFEW